MVNKLASAHESGTLTRGCSVLVTAALNEERHGDDSAPITLKVKAEGGEEFTEVDPKLYLKGKEEQK